MVFDINPDGAQFSIKDTNMLAADLPGFPFSLGVRPQVMKLRWVSPALKGIFFKPVRPLAGLLAAADSEYRHHSIPSRQMRSFIGDTVSIIYAPFIFQNHRFFDVVMERAIAQPFEEAVLDHTTHTLESTLRFHPMLCPACGWDLSAERGALVVFCHNCNSAWHIGEKNLEELTCMDMSTEEDPCLGLPFWRIQACLREIELFTYADLIRLANLPKTVDRRTQDQLLYFYVPAFKVHPQMFLRLSRMLTGQQRIPAAPAQFKASVRHPVTLPLTEASEFIKTLVGFVAVRKERVLSKLSEAAPEIKEYSLCYFPFYKRGNELIEPSMQVSISANTLFWGRSL